MQLIPGYRHCKSSIMIIMSTVHALIYAGMLQLNHWLTPLRTTIPVWKLGQHDCHCAYLSYLHIYLLCSIDSGVCVETTPTVSEATPPCTEEEMNLALIRLQTLAAEISSNLRKAEFTTPP